MMKVLSHTGFIALCGWNCEQWFSGNLDLDSREPNHKLSVPYAMNLLSWIKVLQHKVHISLFAARLKLLSGNIRLTCLLRLSLHILCMMPDSLYFCAYIKVITWWHKAWHSTRASKQAQQLPHPSYYSCSCCLLHIHAHIDYFPSFPATRNKTFWQSL